MSIIAWGARGLAVIRLRDPHGAAPSVPVASLPTNTAASQSLALPSEISSASAIPSISDLLPPHATQDPCDTLMARVKAGLSLDASKNCALLRQEIAASRSNNGAEGHTGVRHASAVQLLLMYEWLERVLPSLTPESFESHAIFSRLADSDAALHLQLSEEDACGPLTAYISELRKIALTQCGWSPLPGRDLAASVLAELARRPALTISAVASLVPVPLVRRCGEDGESERAAAVAMLHGYAGPAVEILNVAAAELRAKMAGAVPATIQDLHTYTAMVGAMSMHAEMLQLTAMAIAGCPGPALDSGDRPGNLEAAQRDANRQVWLNSCKSLIARVDGRKHPYLKICLAVLIEVADTAPDSDNSEASPSPVPAFAVPEPTNSSLFASSERGRSGGLGSISDAGVSSTVANTKRWPAHRLDTLTSRKHNADTADGRASISSTPMLGAVRAARASDVSPLHSPDAKPLDSSEMNQSYLLTSEKLQGVHSNVSLEAMALPPPAASSPPRPSDDAQSTSSDDEDHIEICLNDRVAFACRFLSDMPLPDYIDTITAECVETGRIDGLLLTGISSLGAELVQRYLDSTADVQTAAILGCFFLRVAQLKLAKSVMRKGSVPAETDGLLHARDWKMVQRAWRWIQSYREVLSRSQLWSERAKFDVMRSKLLNHQFKGYVPSSAGSSKPAAMSQSDAERESIMILLGKAGYGHGLVPQPAVEASKLPQASVPEDKDEEAARQKDLMKALSNGMLDLGPKRSQMYVRCASCRSSLSLPALVEGSASAVDWLSKQRPFMLACPVCRKSLPKCSLCLLPLGSINPVLQLQHEMKQRNAARAAAGIDVLRSPALATARVTAEAEEKPAPTDGQASSNLFDLKPPGNLRDAMNFDDFWCWCQSCKHGGHASHLAEWFASKSVCPVAECMCHCTKMDGFASALEGIRATMLSSGSNSRWGAPFTGGKISSDDHRKADS